MTDAKTLAYINLHAVLGSIPRLCELDERARELIKNEKVSLGFRVKGGPSGALCFADGISVVSEGIWENRFKYTDELRKMGANIMVEGKTATITGGFKMTGARVKAVDLRGGAAVLIAALAAEGTSEITGIEVIERGYHDIVGKLEKLGANIQKDSFSVTTAKIN